MDEFPFPRFISLFHSSECIYLLALMVGNCNPDLPSNINLKKIYSSCLRIT